MGVIIFGGVSSRDFGVIVENYPAINHGALRGEGYQIAGRNGTFYSDDFTVDNYVQAYNIAIIEKNRGAAGRCADLAAWLMAPSAYTSFQRLEDSFEPEYYKWARYAGPLNIEQIMGRWGRCTLEFECRPERWLKSGEIPVTVSSTSITLHNPTPYKAKPLIKITRTDDTDIKIGNDKYLTVTYSSATATIYIDCAEGTIKTGSGTNLYNLATFFHTYNDFPTLAPETDTTITCTNATEISVTPRWYVL